MAEVIYTDEQRQPWWVVGLFLLLAIVAVVFGLKEDSWLTMVVGIALALGCLTFSVKAEVHRDSVIVTFRPLKRKTIPVEDIASAEAISYSPLRDYGGWGLKYSGKNNGWAYTLYGTKGVRLTFKDGKTLLVGAEHPGELAAAIQGLLGSGQSGSPG